MFPLKNYLKYGKLAVALVLVLITVRLMIVRNRNSNSQHIFGHIQHDRLAYEQARTFETEINNKYQFTAIILHWKRLTGVRRAVENYVHSQLFKEIIIWNNNPNVSLTVDLLNVSHATSLIRIINSATNIRDEAKFRACALARTLACFYADDDWDTSGYMRSLIAGFRSDPNVLHTVTNIPTYYNNLLWTFMDKTIDLHAGFAWIGCGSVFLREYAERHIQLLLINVQSRPGTGDELVVKSTILKSIFRITRIW
jgi:hypothetical protein